MKRLWPALVLLALVFSLVGHQPATLTASNGSTIAAVPYVPPAAQTPQTDPEKITVYVTRTGAKYHRDGCRYLSRSKIPMSLKEAAARYTPCSVCKPPVLKQ